MDTNLKSYVKIYENWFDKSVCVETVADLQNRNWEKNFFYNAHTDNRYSPSGDKEHYITFDITSTNQYMMDQIWKAIHKYTVELQFPWFTNWTGFNKIKYNRYEPGQIMELHCDHIKSMFDGNRKGNPTLTLLGSLNDDYEGGDLIMWEDTTYHLKAGDLMVFPSTFLYPHKVSEVTKGTRYTFVSWTW